MLSTQQPEAIDTLVNLDIRDFDFLTSIKKTMLEMINVDLSLEEIIHRILNSYQSDVSYISIVNITGKVKFSLNEIKRLSTFSDSERRALEYVLLSDKRNEDVRILTGLIKTELEVNRGSVSEYDKENINVNKLWNELEREYDSKFRSWKLRGGIKKLIIKSTIVSYMLNENNAW